MAVLSTARPAPPQAGSEEYTTGRRRRRRERPDPWLLGAMFVLAAALAVAIARSFQADIVLAFQDAPSHLLVPRRVFDNADATIAQLGVHWTPLLHLLTAPFIMIEPLFRSGAAGTIVSGVSVLVAGFYAFALSRILGAPRHAAAASVVLLACAPSLLVAGALPMLYTLVVACLLANVFYVARWAQDGRGTSLLAMGLTLSLATLAHFELWILLPAELLVVLVIERRRRNVHGHLEATLLLWALSGGYGAAVFILFNLIIFGSPVAFLAVGSGGADVFGTARRGLGALGDWPQAAYLNAGPCLTVAGLGGLLILLWRERGRPEILAPLLLLAAPLAWYTFQASTSGSIIEPAEEMGDWRNLRYGVTAIPALAIWAAVGLRGVAALALVVAAAGLFAVGQVQAGQVALWEDAERDVPYAPRLENVARLTASYAGEGLIWMPTHHYFEDRFQLESRLDSARFVDANDTVLFRELGRNPERAQARGVRLIAWVGNDGVGVMRRVLERTGARPCHVEPVPEAGRYLLRLWVLGDGGCGAARAPR